jgi:hypothetical protein
MKTTKPAHLYQTNKGVQVMHLKVTEAKLTDWWIKHYNKAVWIMVGAVGVSTLIALFFG